MRAFCKLHVPVNLNSKPDTDPAVAILAKISKTEVDFSIPLILKGPKKRAARFATQIYRNVKFAESSHNVPHLQKEIRGETTKLKRERMM